MKYAHLDHITDDMDDEDLHPTVTDVHVHLRVVAGGKEANIPGCPDLFFLRQDSDLERVRKRIQAHIDNLSNSDAARFLAHNRKRMNKDSVRMTVRVPKAILNEVMNEQDP